jgi:hypothetical protein
MSWGVDIEQATLVSDVEPEEEIDLLRAAAITAFRSDCTPPSLLSVCRESRAVASKYYQKLFATPHAPARTYVDFDRDTIFVRYDEFSPDALDFEDSLDEMSRVQEGGFMMVKNVAVLADDADEGNYWGLDEPLAADLLMRIFPRLAKLTIVLEAVERPPGDESPTCFIEPINFEATLSSYENYVEDRAWQSRERPDEVWLEFATIRPDFLEKITVRSTKAGDLPPLIPAIEYKVAVTSYQEEYLEYVREAAETFWQKAEQELAESLLGDI